MYQVPGGNPPQLPGGHQRGTSVVPYIIIVILAVALTGVVAYDLGRGSVPRTNLTSQNLGIEDTGTIPGQPYLEPIVVPNREIPLSNSTYSYTSPDGKVHELDGEQTGSLTPDGRFIPVVTATPARR